MPYWVSLTLKGETQTAFLVFRVGSFYKHFSDGHSFSAPDLKKTGREEDATESRFGSRGNVNEESIRQGEKKPKPTPTYSGLGCAGNMRTLQALPPHCPQRPTRGAAMPPHPGDTGGVTAAPPKRFPATSHHSHIWGSREDPQSPSLYGHKNRGARGAAEGGTRASTTGMSTWFHASQINRSSKRCTKK